jgi:pimeloyl-ACP methyl ester carboxylesterase
MERRSRTTAKGADRPSSWWAEPSSTDRRTPPSLRNWRSRSPSTTTTARPWRQRRHPAVRRGSEIEDLEALIAEAGGSAHLYGISSGGALALEAAAAGASVDKLAVYEVPYNTADDGPRRQREYVEQLGALLAQERRR